MVEVNGKLDTLRSGQGTTSKEEDSKSTGVCQEQTVGEKCLRVVQEVNRPNKGRPNFHRYIDKHRNFVKVKVNEPEVEPNIPVLYTPEWSIKKEEELARWKYVTHRL